MDEGGESLCNYIEVAPRVYRSVNLERDFQKPGALEGYVLTGAARSFLSRIAGALSPSSAQRAWSLIGAYGTGKSALALFVAHVLDNQATPGNEEARELLRAEDDGLFRHLFDKRRKSALCHDGLLPVLVTGRRDSLPLCLLKSLHQGMRKHWLQGAAAPTALLQRLEDLIARAQSGAVLSGREVAELFEVASREDGAGSGLLLVVDELGKFLEHAATCPDTSDLSVLQELAEAASRSGDRPLLVVTLLHQAFDRYAARLTPQEREEWAKVQGRFEDVAFQESSEHILRIAASAIRHIEGSPVAAEIRRHSKLLTNQAVELGLVPAGVSQGDFDALCTACYPLHPTVSLLAGQLFRRLAQNERSLFAFLSSYEPGALQEFLHGTKWQADLPPSFGLDRLYDYLASNLSSSLSSSVVSKRWVEGESALARVDTADLVGRRILKSIALLALVGPLGNLKASKGLLMFACGEHDHVVEQSLQRLVQKSLIVYRSHVGAYALWEGSDLDIDQCLDIARQKVDTSLDLAALLRRHTPLRPVVARRHSFTHGALRYFEVRFVDSATLEASLLEKSEEADGTILCVLPGGEAEAERIKAHLTRLDLPRRDDLLIAVPKQHGTLREAAKQLVLLRWVAENTPELAGDHTARRELHARIAEVGQWLDQQLQSLLAHNDEDASGSSWFHKGKRVKLGAGRSLNQRLSEICDRVYHRSPRILNELINRQGLSSAASAARRNLLEAMLSHQDCPRLGIQGYPPELSMYQSLLEATGVHREVRGAWGFHPPAPDGCANCEPLWEMMSEFLERTQSSPKSVALLFDELRTAPYGVKAGLMPVFLLAFLLYQAHDVALYEKGSYVPSITLPAMERLIKSPSDFSVQKTALTTSMVSAYDALYRAVNGGDVPPCRRELLAIVRPLCRRLEHLVPYARRTRRVSGKAAQLRSAIQQARRPDILLFEAIPEALGHAQGDFDSPDALESLEGDVRNALSELETAYDQLLDFVEGRLFTVLGVPKATDNRRAELAEDAGHLLKVCKDVRLKSFLVRLAEKDVSRQEWIESLGDLLGGKPPSSWLDEDVEKFEFKLLDVARLYVHLRAVAFDSGLVGGKHAEAFRIALTKLGIPERERVVAIDEVNAEAAAKASLKLQETLEVMGIHDNPDICLSAIAKLVDFYICQGER